MRIRLVIVLVFAALWTAGYLFPRVALNASGESAPQVKQKKRPARRSGQTATGARAAKDYSSFSHRSAKHRSLACDSCHTAPTANWLKASAFPDVADYPGHASCVGCHRTEFFKGARPNICSICHTKVSPRDGARFAFDKPGAPSQFNAVFPHDKHQDVIAAAGFDRGFRAAHAGQENAAQKYNNCAICHQTNDETPKPAGGFPDNFEPPAGTFKASPAGHASCFNCHWKNQEPTHNDCAGCHDLSQTDVLQLAAPSRKSLKFTHTREQHIAECTTCHINITRASSLRGLKPDVPITSCATCHKTSTDAAIATIETEFEKRNRDPAFVCAKCHTSEVGRLATPASHRRLFSE
ncbi:MAG: hypothetical protein JO360_06150 [Acidobacteria bacterium]|nr:hypothetical protein [Acidobacteriota bacterium]